MIVVSVFQRDKLKLNSSSCPSIYTEMFTLNKDSMHFY